jgi:hypothetical protein
MLSFEDQRDLSVAMADLSNRAQELSAQGQAFGPTDDIKKRVQEWVDSVLEVADRFKAKTYTVSLNIPWGVSASFTWWESS